jgi:hypothetical protein
MSDPFGSFGSFHLRQLLQLLRAAIERGAALGLKPGDLVEPKKVLKELEKAEKALLALLMLNDV